MMVCSIVTQFLQNYCNPQPYNPSTPYNPYPAPFPGQSSNPYPAPFNNQGSNPFGNPFGNPYGTQRLFNPYMSGMANPPFRNPYMQSNPFGAPFQGGNQGGTTFQANDPTETHTPSGAPVGWDPAPASK